MASIGWASLQIIPTMQGIAGQVNSQLVQPMQQGGQQAGQAAGQGMASGLASQQTTVEKASSQLAAARGKEADAAGKVRVAELKLQELRDKGTASASQIAAAEERLATANRGHDNAMAGRVRAVGNLTEARARAANGADDEADAVDDATDAQERNGDSALDLAKKLGGLAIAAAGIGSAMDLATQSMEKSQLGSKMAASLGESPEEAKQYGKIAGNLYASGIGESMEDVAASVAAVSGTFGSLDSMGAGRLEELSGKASNFAAVFDQDVAGSIETAGLMMQNGLADNADQAFDMMTRGMQEVSVGMREEIPAILNEYGTNFRALGFNGQDAFNMLIAASQGGAIALDKTGDALKEFTIRGADMSTSSVDTFKLIGLSGEEMAKAIATGGEGAQEALQKTADGLLKIKDPAERANAAIALFGAPLEDMSVDKIPGFLESLAGTEDVMGDVTGATDQMTETLNDNAGAAFENMKRAITGELLNGLESMADWVGRNTELLKTIGIIISPLIAGLVAYKAITLGMAAATATWNAIQMLLNGTMMLNPIGLIIAAIVGLVAIVVLIATKTTWFQTIWEVVWNAVSTAWDWVWGKLKEGFELLKLAFQAIGDKAGEVKDWVVNKWNEMVGFVTGLPGRISSAVGGMWDGVKNAFKGALNWIIDKWNNFKIPAIKVAGVQVSPEINFPDIARFATGGELRGPGTGTSDDILMWGSNGEHMWTDKEVKAVGGHDAMYRMRGAALAGDLPAFAGGGAIGGMNAGIKDGRNSNLQVYKDWSMVPTGPKQTTMDVNPNAFGMGDAPAKGGVFGGGPGTGNGGGNSGTGTSGTGGGGGGDLGGGEVNASIWNVISAKFPDATLNSGMRPGDGGFHGIGKAVDIGGSEQTMQNVADYAFNDLRMDLAQIIWNKGPVWYNVRDNELGNGVATASGAEARAIYGEGQMAVHADHVHIAAERALKAAASASSPSSDSSTSASGTSGTSDKAESKTEATKVFSARDRWKTMFTDIGATWADASIEIAGVGEYLDLADRYTLKDSAATSDSPTESTLSKQEKDLALAGPGTPDNVVRTGADLYAFEIARAAKEMNLGKAAAIIGEATALVEAGDPMKMWANAKVPGSLGMKHDAVGMDGTSTGLFQQQDNGAWGSLAQRMNPFESAKLFYSALPANWASMEPGVAAQSVQRSAFPSKYGQMMGRGANLVDNTSLFDTGGVWEPGTFGFNGLNEPELVLKDAHWKTAEANIAKVDELVGAGASTRGPAVVQNFHTTVADQAGFQRQTTRRLGVAMMQYGGRP